MEGGCFIYFLFLARDTSIQGCHLVAVIVRGFPVPTCHTARSFPSFVGSNLSSPLLLATVVPASSFIAHGASRRRLVLFRRVGKHDCTESLS